VAYAQGRFQAITPMTTGDGSGTPTANPTIADLVRVLDGEVVCCEENLQRPVKDFGASDLLSDVLAVEKVDYALLTGLTNAQVVRTADITSACCVVIVRNKQPQPAAVTLAKRCGIPLILCRYTMFDACCRVAEHLKTPHGGTQGTPNPTGT